MKTSIKRIVTCALCFSLALSLFASSTLSVDAKAKKKTTKASKNVVVVLDAGHDNTHLGCHYEGFEEGIANLYIAYYCKQELEKYNGVTVYMTRYGFDCPYGANPDSSADCLTGRVNYAKSVNADILISLHNDYDPDLDKSQNGAKVIIPNPNYRPDLCVKGSDLGKSILTNLTTTGLTINDWKLCPNGTGIVTRDSENGKYPDGSAKDYYALINKSKSSGFPCIIVEHAFCTNNSDRINHLSTTDQYQQLGIADATGIAQYYGLSLK
ncbi:N-acetylmuramoyl-L-alanine amidase [Pseudobutyrivibrio xylanivorans]|uniref:N-acetylmuramoyl-L-alanine amidase n=1 Tax=Pseudobutyrivibrio xylanivorans DSM 14809 TaxID=1123012 RepID=A0A1M6FB62_PSEXY|nr:N-acetylmuramoyl-L-alanine amidase [Pseudobutyrivibrio xylanivorans]SHI94940.1 N-acetylmuramoyl-L-alanine amidase [Pseudobutyrivibrio xylanivorans DSM 14809]